jgi:DNA-binding beta-propeller fold protein YncE
VAGWWNDEVLGVDPAGFEVARIPVESPRKIAVNESDGDLWVAADWGVGWYSMEGDLRLDFPLVEDPRDIVVDPVSGTCWVAEGTGSLWVRSPGGAVDRLEGFGRPFSLAASGDGDVWMVDTDLRTVYRFHGTTGARLGSTGDAAQPVDVVDAPGGAWVADWSGNAVVRLGDDMESILRLTGFDRPRGVATGAADSTLWVVEAGGGRVTKVTTDGERLGTVGGLDFPKDIVVVH